jgi:hypothetical protein
MPFTGPASPRRSVCAPGRWPFHCIADLSESGKIAARGAAVTGLGVVGSFTSAQHAPKSTLGDFGRTPIGPNGQVMVAYQAPYTGEGPSTNYTHLDSDGLANGGFGSQRLVTPSQRT